MKKEYFDFHDIVEIYGVSGEDTNIAVGLRPSGRIHLGNMATLGLAGYLGKHIGPHFSKIQVTLCDLELPDFRDRRDNRKFVRYYDSLPDPKGEYKSLLEASTVQLVEFFDAMGSYFGVPINMRLLSDIQREPKFRRGLKKLLDDSESMTIVYPGASARKAFVFPLCPDCKTSSNKTSPYNKDTGILKTNCKNSQCKQDAFSVDILDTSKDLAMHNFIDPLRDCWVDHKPQIHVFGGDYRSGYWGSPMPQIERIVEIMERSGGCVAPDILLGPTFFASNGYKMSKGKDNGLTLDILKRHFGDETFPKIFDLVEKITNKNMKVVDYSFIEDTLFS